MSDVATITPVTAALLVALKTIGRPIGDAAKPSSPNPPPMSFYPYAVLRVNAQALDGSYVHPHEDALCRVQVTANGRTRDSVDWLLDRAREVLLDVDLTIDGYAVVWSKHIDGQPPDWDADVSPAVFYGLDVFHIFVTPTASGS